MKMKKLIALLLTGLMLVSLLAGCAASKDMVAMDTETFAPMENGALADGIYDSLKREELDSDYEASTDEKPSVTQRKGSAL